MTSYTCPKCGGIMSGQRVWTCAGCRGVWVPEWRFGDEVGDGGLPTNLIKALAEDPRDTSLACPACSGDTLRASVYKEIELDWCATCRGLYFDADELERVKGKTGGALDAYLDTTRGHGTLEVDVIGWLVGLLGDR